MKFKLLILSIISVYTFISCNTKSDKSSTAIEENILDLKLASIYPLNNQHLELQNLEFVETFDESRNIKNTTGKPPA